MNTRKDGPVLTFRKLFPVLLLLASRLFSASAPRLTSEQTEAFLTNGAITGNKAIGVGITDTRRVTLTLGTLRHDAQVQCVDVVKNEAQQDDGTTEANFRDSWKYNVAAYRLGKILGLEDMIPVSIERKVNGTHCAVTWWVDNAVMEIDRRKKKLVAPDIDAWNRDTDVITVFDQLIYNTDRNLGNILIDPSWHMWMIDHTRAFRLYYTLRDKKVLSRCDRKLLERMRELNAEALIPLKPYLNDDEIKGLLRRRDVLVQFFDDAVRKQGEAAVLFDRPAR
jgi:hypothetical protein